LFDRFKSSLSSTFFERLVNHDTNIDSYHDSHVGDHRITHEKLVLFVSIELRKAHEVIDLDNTEKVVDPIQEVIIHRSEPCTTI